MPPEWPPEHAQPYRAVRLGVCPVRGVRRWATSNQSESHMPPYVLDMIYASARFLIFQTSRDDFHRGDLTGSSSPRIVRHYIFQGRKWIPWFPIELPLAIESAVATNVSTPRNGLGFGWVLSVLGQPDPLRSVNVSSGRGIRIS